MDFSLGEFTVPPRRGAVHGVGQTPPEKGPTVFGIAVNQGRECVPVVRLPCGCMEEVGNECDWPFS
jgi:hypothetical protein